MKYDRSRQGDLTEGSDWPDVELQTLTKDTIRLSEIYRTRDKPLVLIGASRS